MISTAKKLIELFSPRERIGLVALCGLTILAAAIDVVGIVSIMPFIAVVATPEMIETNHWLNTAYKLFGFTTRNSFLFALGMGVLGCLIINNLFKAWFAWLQLRYANMRESSLSSRLLGHYLAQPYVFFLDRNTSEMSRNILSLVATVINGVVRQFLSLVEKIIGALFIIILLIMVDPWLALSTSVILGTLYGIVYIVVRARLLAWGGQIVDANLLRYKLSQEALNGIKDLKILGRERFFINGFLRHSMRNAALATKSNTTALIPMYSLEILAFGGILCIVLYFITVKQNLAQVLPLVALYAFAAKRIMPALQGIFTAVSSMRFNSAALDVLYRDLANIKMREPQLDRGSDIQPLPLRRDLELKKICFTYPNRDEPAIKDINLAIQANTCIAFVGPTGSGKTTLVDIILGLLEPQAGEMLVDGIRIDATTRPRWQKNIGYVPQHIFLSDDTVTRNIAFGLPDDAIVMDKVKHAARIANIAAFIETELPQGYETIIGERGVRLSGGERQRIGIARAVYHDPAVLILDEATSALDGVTESAVMDAIQALATRKTIILIAHRLTTVKDCNFIYLLENGRIKTSGTYAELMKNSEDFRAMSRVIAADNVGNHA